MEKGEGKNDMSYEEFVEKLKKSIQGDLGYRKEEIEFFEAGYQAIEPKAIQFIRDVNHTYTGEDSPVLLLDVLLLKKEILPEVYQIQRVDTKSLYQVALKEGYEEALSRIPENKGKNQAGPIGIDRLKMRVSGNYQDVQDQLIVRPLNYDLHAGELEKAVYRRMGDVTLVLYQILNDTDPKNFLTSKIQKPELRRWNMEDREDEVLDAALQNTAKLYPAVVYDWKRKDETDFLKGSFTREEISFPKNGIMLTTHLSVNGAAALFYPGVVPKMMEIMGGPFAAVFMNTTDVMILDKDDAMLESWMKTAGEKTSIGEYLSDKSYVCDEHGIHVNHPAE